MSLLCGKALEFFRDQLKHLPGNYLEIGVYDGELIGTLAREFPEKHFFGVDPFIEDGHTTQHNGVAFGQPMDKQRESAHRILNPLKNVTLVECTSIKFAEYVFPRLDQNPNDGNISAVLIDGSHHYKDADNDFRLASRLLNNGGVLYADDLGTEGVNKACIEFVSREFSRILKRDAEKFWLGPA